MIDQLKFEFYEVQIYKNHLVGIAKEGETITPDFMEVLMGIIDTYFNNIPFIYISHRINSYAVDPTIYIHLSKITNLKGFAIVTSDRNVQASAHVEKLFFTKPFQVFDTLNEAIEWSKSFSK